jgi:hypothetical protein
MNIIYSTVKQLPLNPIFFLWSTAAGRKLAWMAKEQIGKSRKTVQLQKLEIQTKISKICHGLMAHTKCSSSLFISVLRRVW